MAAKAYHRDQAGAPALTYGTGSNINHFTQLKTVLKACLVAGYGALPAAGWELIAEGTQYIVLRNGSHSGYVCFTCLSPTSSASIQVTLSSTFTGVDASFVMTGDGVKSGTNASSSPVPHKINMQYAFYHTNACSWSMVADDKTFVLNLSSITVTSDPPEIISGNSQIGSSVLYCGEDTNGWFIAMGGENNTPAPVNYFSSVGFTSLKDPSTGLLVGAGALLPGGSGLTNVSTYQSLYQVVPEVEMVKVHWVAKGAAAAAVYAGRFRGVAIPGALYCLFPSYCAYAMGVTPPFNYRNANTPIPLGDTYTWFLTVKYTAGPTIMLTDNPEYW